MIVRAADELRSKQLSKYTSNNSRQQLLMWQLRPGQPAGKNCNRDTFYIQQINAGEAGLFFKFLVTRRSCARTGSVRLLRAIDYGKCN